MDVGPAKRRKRGFSVERMDVSFIMTTAQVATLDGFIKNTIKGTARFDFAHPITGLTVEVRIVPNNDQMYSTTGIAPNYWSVALALEVVP